MYPFQLLTFIHSFVCLFAKSCMFIRTFIHGSISMNNFLFKKYIFDYMYTRNVEIGCRQLYCSVQLECESIRKYGKRTQIRETFSSLFLENYQLLLYTYLWLNEWLKFDLNTRLLKLPYFYVKIDNYNFNIISLVSKLNSFIKLISLWF